MAHGANHVLVVTSPRAMRCRTLYTSAHICCAPALLFLLRVCVLLKLIVIKCNRACIQVECEFAVTRKQCLGDPSQLLL